MVDGIGKEKCRKTAEKFVLRRKALEPAVSQPIHGRRHLSIDIDKKDNTMEVPLA